MKLNQMRFVFPRRKGCSIVGSCQPAWRLSWALIIIALPGCRSEMYDQPRYEPLERSEFFDDGDFITAAGQRNCSSDGPSRDAPGA